MPQTDTRTSLGIGMVGYNIGRVHSHAWLNMPLFYHPPPANPILVAIAGRNPDKVRDFARKFGYKRTYQNFRDLVKDSEVNIVDLCTPPYVHHEESIASFDAGKHVICEKPLARTGKEAKEMWKSAERAGVKHMTGFNYRFIPAVCYARKLIQEGFIGKLLHFRGAYLNIEVGDLGYLNPEFPLDWHFKRDTAGYGALSDLGSHIIDIARFLVGEVSAVAGATATFIKERPLPGTPNTKGIVEVDDSTVAAVKFANGALGTIEASWMAPGRKDFLRFEILGSEGSLRFNLERLNELEIFTLRDSNEQRGFRDVWTTSKTHPFMDKFWTEQGGGFGWDHAFVNEVHHFTDCIVNDKPIEPIGATFFDGYRNCQIMDAIVESAETERWVHVID
ncbi:MAG TPA: Gfo/Idh/MocA family oxidoreductase [Candidatus Acidoferrales bacterium]|nr:Gfo/Idh/MocA family oxidoreductase [Candidatus Acidoferrales bacterium]